MDIYRFKEVTNVLLFYYYIRKTILNNAYSLLEYRKYRRNIKNILA